MRTVRLPVQSERIVSTMSILNYFRKIDKVPSDNDEGLKELLGPNVLKEANAELRRVTDSPEPGCSLGLHLRQNAGIMCILKRSIA